MYAYIYIYTHMQQQQQKLLKQQQVRHSLCLGVLKTLQDTFIVLRCLEASSLECLQAS